MLAYNFCFKFRVIIEHSFALLFGRFRRLQFLNMNKIEYVPATILAVCVLHNICIDYPDENVDLYIAEGREAAERNKTWPQAVNIDAE